ncbi:hypothetical protein [Streptomyces sp. NPDC001933]|uniref:hypothetical protein n=1 Tax=Streptomyces sp. NPDC001933 TaxID=3364626 RepID=UPI0036BE8DB9
MELDERDAVRNAGWSDAGRHSRGPEFPISLGRVSVGSFVRRNHAALDGILPVAEEGGGFPESTMALVDELGRHRDHELTAPSLLLWPEGNSVLRCPN